MEKLAEDKNFISLMKRIEELSKNQKEIKKEYKCSCCKDTGQIVVKRKINGKIYNGIIECKCRKIARYEKNIEKSGLKSKLNNTKFDNFNAYNNELKLNKALALSFANELDADSILLLGQSGSGKTHLATAICGTILYKHKIPLIYATYREIIATVKPLTMDISGRIKAMNKYLNVSVLYIDDLFKGTATETDESIIFEILDYRYSRGLKTIITSEISIEELINRNEALIGRVIEQSNGYILNFNDTGNYRLKNLNDKTKNKALDSLNKYKNFL